MYLNLSSKSLFYAESVLFDFGSYILICRNDIENTAFMLISELKRIYEIKSPNLIPEGSDPFLSCCDTLFENGNGRGTPLVIPPR